MAKTKGKATKERAPKRGGPTEVPVNVVNILGKLYAIEQKVPQVHEEKWFGFADETGQRIVYTSEQGPDQCRDTVLHEIVHILEQQLVCGLKEREVSVLATGLYQIMRDNPELMEWILEPL